MLQATVALTTEAEVVTRAVKPAATSPEVA